VARAYGWVGAEMQSRRWLLFEILRRDVLDAEICLLFLSSVSFEHILLPNVPSFRRWRFVMKLSPFYYQNTVVKLAKLDEVLRTARVASSPHLNSSL
jgi:hypothetical protein